MPDATYTRAPLTSERSEDDPGPSSDGVGIAPEGPSGSVSGRPGTARATETAPGRNRTDCPGCVFLREQVDLLVASRGRLIEANFALAARASAAEQALGRRTAEQRQQAAFLTGLADLQRAEAAG